MKKKQVKNARKCRSKTKTFFIFFRLVYYSEVYGEAGNKVELYFLLINWRAGNKVTLFPETKLKNNKNMYSPGKTGTLFTSVNLDKPGNNRNFIAGLDVREFLISPGHFLGKWTPHISIRRKIFFCNLFASRNWMNSNQKRIA